MTITNPLRYYDLEGYLAGEVRARFAADHSLGAFDFFSIVIWKANRAKSLIARRLRKLDPERRTSLDPIVRDLTHSLYGASDPKERLNILITRWGVHAPDGERDIIVPLA